MLVGPINSRPSKKHWIGWKEVSEKAMAVLQVVLQVVP